jgi:hypothetical protein
VFAQNTDTYYSFNQKSNKKDFIFTSKYDSIAVQIKDMTDNDISYSYPQKDKIHKISKSEVYKIKFADGREVLMTEKNNIKPDNEGDEYNSKKNAGSQQSNKSVNSPNVTVVHSPDSVLYMKNVGDIDVKFIGDDLKSSNDFLTKHVLNIAKKKVLTQGGDFLLILDIKINIEYGELPYIELIGTAFKKL